MYVAQHSRTEHLWTVGFFRPDGTWHPVADWVDQLDAEKHVHYLNGGKSFDPHPSQVGTTPDKGNTEKPFELLKLEDEE